jgi:LacI family transcriptional regulator
VARYAGVSTAVVSYVVNNGPRKVAPATAERVRRAIEVLDYRPNVSAQALRRGTTEMIGLVLSDPSNPFFTEFAAAIGVEAFDRGHALIIGTTLASAQRETHLVDDLVRRQVAGLIVASAYGRPDEQLSRSSRSARIVWIDAQGEIPGYSSVGVDSRRGARNAVEHLIDVHHHDSVGLVVGGVGSPSSDPRELGWQEALRLAGLPDGPIARVAWSREGGYAGGCRLLAGRNRPTAIFVSSDLQAIGVLRAAHEQGLRVPDDLAVVGFDGTEESKFCWPPLTVIAQPVQAMASAAVRLALDPDPEKTFHKYEGTLLTRMSCGCQPQSGDS